MSLITKINSLKSIFYWEVRKNAFSIVIGCEDLEPGTYHEIVIYDGESQDQDFEAMLYEGFHVGDSVGKKFGTALRKFVNEGHDLGNFSRLQKRIDKFKKGMDLKYG